jgi:hypothetical protein
VSVDVEFSSALRTVLVEASTASWEFWFGLLQQFKEAEGHCLVNQTHEINGYRLGAWVAQQRLYSSSLHPLRYQKLSQLGFVWDALEHRWEIGCTALKRFYSREGHSRVLKDYVEDGFMLGKWVRSLRGRKNGLSREKIDDLKAFDFIWHPYDEAWDEAYAVLKLFVEREGHSLVPQRHSEGGFSLGSWVNSQRNNKPKLSFEQIQALDELQFIWDVRNVSWNTGFESLRHFFLREGHSNPRADHIEGDFKLGRWVSKQRSRKPALSSKQFEKLKQLDFVWDARDAAWSLMFDYLQEYHEENGHCLVPVLYEVDGAKLGTWVRNRRKEVTKMCPKRKQMLDGIGFIWDTSKDKT